MVTLLHPPSREEIHTLLITRPLEEVPMLEAFCAERNIRLIAESFIRFEAVKAEIPSSMETLFFGSSRAVDFFLAQSAIPANCEIACIGPATASYLEQKGYRVHFSGEKAGNPDEVAEALKVWLGNRKLYIAQSAQSNRSMAKALPAEQVHEIVVYQTITVSKTVDVPLDHLIFTSPSNLEGFLISNSISPETKITAWGKTTEKALKNKGYQPYFVLKEASEAELISILS